ncbi:MAG TPA: hypothetical protein ENK66_10535, partial [Arcobacter sp.]|nr:hypothetical protein [Arcobacter sp.]
FTNLLAGTYCIAFTNLPADHNVTLPNQGNDNNDSDANSQAQITNISLSSDTLDQDMGLFDATPVVVPPTNQTIQIGDRVWIENDNDGNARTGIVSALSGITITAISSNGTHYSTQTDNNGSYIINVPINDSYVVSLPTPDGYIPTNNSKDNNITDEMSENDLSHDSNGTTVTVTTIDNLTVDFGFRTSPTILGVTTCEVMTVNDDIQNANEKNATTIINILNNDIGSKENQQIKFLSLTEGKRLWESNEQNITTVTTLDTLTVQGEGTWRVINNQIVFTALNSFDGKIPTPIYYIVEGFDCSDDTKYSNVAQVTINTSCYCPAYITKSVGAFNLVSMLLLVSLTLMLSFFFTRSKDNLSN